MRYVGISLALILTIAPEAGAHDNWCGYNFTQLSVPDAQGRVDNTGLTDLNNHHLILASDGLTSYLLDGGLFEEIVSVPGSTGTLARNINNRGEIVGNTIIRTKGGSFTRPAFYRDQQGRYTAFTPPNAIQADAWGISEKGVIVGAYRDPARTHGFILKNGSFETIDAPFEENTRLMSVNRKTIVGISVNNEGTRVQSFLLSEGVFTLLEIPGAFPFTVEVRDINERGQITGTYAETDPAASASFKVRSFVLTDDHVILIDAPFPNTQFTQVTGINNNGELVGRVYIGDGHNVGFTAVPRNCGNTTSHPGD